MSDITSIMLGCYCHVRQPDSPMILRGFITHVDPAWMNVAEFTPLLSDRRKASLGPLCFVTVLPAGMAGHPDPLTVSIRAAFEPSDAIYDATEGVYRLDFSKVIAFTTRTGLHVQRGEHGKR